MRRHCHLPYVHFYYCVFFLEDELFITSLSLSEWQHLVETYSHSDSFPSLPIRTSVFIGIAAKVVLSYLAE